MNYDDLLNDDVSGISITNGTTSNKRRIIESDSSQSLSSNDDTRRSQQQAATSKKSRHDEDPNFRPGMRIDPHVGSTKKPATTNGKTTTKKADPNVSRVRNEFGFEASTPNNSVSPLSFMNHNQVPMDIPVEVNDENTVKNPNSSLLSLKIFENLILLYFLDKWYSG